MKLILGKPDTGKTKELLARSEKNNVPILCESEARVERLLIKASNYGYTIPTPLTLRDLHKGIEKVYIDDVVKFFKCAFGVEVDALTVNYDENLEVVELGS